MKPITRRRFIKLGAGAGLTGLIASYPTLIERHIVHTNTYQILVPNLPPAFTGFRIVHLTDLHYGSLVSDRFIRKVLARANAIPRDITVCTGDYVHKRRATAEIDAVWPLMTRLTAPLGVFSTLGNHDHWADTDRSLYWLARARQDLRHKTIPIQRDGSRIWLTGASDLYEDHADLDPLLADIPESDCRIVLAHNPDTCDTRFSSRIDLMISGHTHGGQVNIPFIGPPVLPVRNKTYSNGLKTSPRGTTLFISRGIGWAMFPIRFNCCPEIAILELLSTPTLA